MKAAINTKNEVINLKIIEDYKSILCDDKINFRCLHGCLTSANQIDEANPTSSPSDIILVVIKGKFI